VTSKSKQAEARSGNASKKTQILILYWCFLVCVIRRK